MATKFILHNVTDYAKNLSLIEEFYQNELVHHRFERTKELTLSALELKGPKQPKETLVIVAGRAEIEHKYAELFYNLRRKSLRAVVLFVRGQGSSTRLIKCSSKNALENFQDYTDDVEFLLQKLEITSFVMLGFSLGGLISLDYLRQKPVKPKKLALIAPYLWPAFGLPEPVLKGVVWLLATLPFTHNSYTPHGGDYKKIDFKENIHSHDQFRYERYHQYYAEHPELALGGPTFSFVHQTLRKQQELYNSSWDFTTPVLCICAGDDRVVSTPHCLRFMRKHDHDIVPPVVMTIPKAYHDLLNESDEYRSRAILTALNFLYFGDQSD